MEQPLCLAWGMRWSSVVLISAPLPLSSPALTGRPGPLDQGWNEEPWGVVRSELLMLCPEGADQKSEGKLCISQEGPVSPRMTGQGCAEEG